MNMTTTVKKGKKLISKSLETYYICEPTKEFWAEWKTSKDDLKKDGVRVFKDRRCYYVAIYDGGKATRAEFEKQEQERFKSFKSHAIDYLHYASICEERIKEVISIISNAKNMREIEESPRMAQIFKGSFFVFDICWRKVLQDELTSK